MLRLLLTFLRWLWRARAPKAAPVTTFVASLLGLSGQHGIYRYVDGVWTRTQDVPAGVSVFNLHRNPAGHLMATTDGATGYYVSTNDGVSWSGSSGAAKNAGSLGWAIGWDENDAIYDTVNAASEVQKSTNGGSTFSTHQPYVQTPDMGFSTTSQSVWVSQGIGYWNERTHQTTVKAALSLYDGSGVSSYLGLDSGGQIMVRGLYEAKNWLLAYGNFFNNLWTWSGISPALTDLTSTLPSMTGTIYSVIPFSTSLWFLAETQSSSMYCRLWRTDDAGATWTMVLNDATAVTSPGVANGGIIFISRNPANHAEYIVAGKGGLWHTADSGGTWDFISAPDGSMEFASVAWIGAEQNCGPVIATDNGFIIKRTAANTYKVVWSGGGVPSTDHDFEGQIISFTPNRLSDPTKFATMCDFGAPDEPLYTDDAGETWHNPYPPTATPSPSGYGFFGGLAKDGTYNWNIDEDGIVWCDTVKIADSHRWFLKSTDATATAFVPAFDFTAAAGGVGLGSTWIGDGFIWWCRTSGTTFNLYRLNVDGTNFQSWTYTASATMRNISLQGWPGTNRLIAWEWLNYATLSPLHNSPVVSIDITDPDNPSFQDTGADPFGTTFAVWDAMPLTNQILVLNTIDETTLLQGGIWRSTDGGATWAQVVANTAQLGEAPTIAGAGADNEICAIAPDPGEPSEVWIAACPPYVYHSANFGETWDVETVDMSIFDPFLTGGSDRWPQEWTGLQVVCSPGSGGGGGPGSGSKLLFGFVGWVG